jgi:hypothetical protein
MHKPSVAFTLLVAALLTACDDNGGPRSPVEPGFTTQSSNVGFQPSIGLGSTSLSSQPVDDVRCPDEPPFFAPFNLTVGAAAGDVFLDAVRFRFADIVGVTMPQVTLAPPSLMNLFGSTNVSAHTSRTFPFLFRFGCGTARRGTLIIIVDTRDARGQVMTTELRATVQ